MPTADDRVIIESTTAMTWPTIDGGTADADQIRMAYQENMVGGLTVTGGAIFNIADDLRFGRQAGSLTATVYISGSGTQVNVGDDIGLGRYGKGIIEMTGGYLGGINTTLTMAYRDGSAGTVNLSDGVIELDAITAGAGLDDGESSEAIFNLLGGTLKLVGDQTATGGGQVPQLVSDGVLQGVGISYWYEASADRTYVVPEPMTICLLGLGGLLIRRKRI